MSAGYIYVKNWNQFQHYKGRDPVWIKLYRALVDEDDYLRLTLADRGLLHDIWKLTALAGNGRVSANRKSLGRRLNVRRVSLEPLIRAGFIEVRASKADSKLLARCSTEVSLTEKPVAAPHHKAARHNGKGSGARARQIAACRRLYNRELEDGETPAAARMTVQYEYRNDPSIVSEAIPA